MLNQKYDTIIIGAGMSGLAAAIRLSMYNKRVLILESHSIPGGLNSYYQRGKRKFDVGLHAMTNYVSKETRGKPLNKLLKQLRIPYEDLKLSEQTNSKIVFPDNELKFTNNIEVLIQEINTNFQSEIDGFIALIEHIKNFNEVSLTNETVMAKNIVRNFIKNETLLEMIFCPLLIYGSAWENDMDFSQFAIMFKSIFLEGFSRPEGGVRTIINLLLEKFKQTTNESGSELKFKSKVTKIIIENNKAIGVEVNNSEIYYCDQILSSAGLPETYSLTEPVEKKDKANPRVGPLSFCEAILLTDKKPIELGINSTIIFYNDRPKYEYRKPNTLFDKSSAVVCFPNNFNYADKYSDDFDEGIIRLTHIASYELWNNVLSESKTKYKEEKELIFENALTILKKCGINDSFNINFKDIFTPTSIERYTHHFGGTVYGSIDKSRDGRTIYENLYVIGTDQGFLGIVGSMLSGISMANFHVLSAGAES
jgi:phytoene dehydrogenase-like protein